MAPANAPIHAQLAAARLVCDQLMTRIDDRAVARLPIDFDLEARAFEAENEVVHLERLLAAGSTSRDDQVPFEPEDLDGTRTVRMAA